MYIALTIFHVLVALVLILVVLLQAGKGASMGAIFGGASQTLFGPRGAGNFLSKLTAIVAAIFMVTSLSLAILSGQRTASSVIERAPEAPRPAAPARSAPAHVPHKSPEKGTGAPLPQGSPPPPAVPGQPGSH
ncbi:MAG: preprotein translocase subunit SecG [Candidatus Tectomicrobia bacterium]|uniref:Protein-export membrane protein SecG n=1 Tax=Tectimicrobiota bacterium TaxID=2528274 RepID=A0A932CM94_UNCTE|nr:preprotein translocase subunit SecG [Candidatus Tectomicrobia bacterium]